ncbi:hypothetical protein [Gemmata sp.]|uniref:hypothetical protein n=1 Tax=Gemmata sp. TaxID=1914242 RepID=UPI003F6F832E
MLRFTLAIALGVAVVTLSGASNNVRAEDKKAEAKTVEGTLTCTKCALKETDKCGHALIVKDGDKKVTYYIADKGAKESYHGKCCKADLEGVKVAGKVTEKDGKKTIEDAKVTLPK